MKLLITGATGFLGSQFLINLVDSDTEIIILKRSFSNINRIKNVINNVISYDIDKVSLSEVFISHKFDCVLHLATCYGRNGEKISDVLINNLLFSIELLELSIANNIPLFINADTLQNKNVSNYTLSKKQFVEWGKAVTTSNAIKFVNLRFEHLYGPGDDKNKFVYWVASQLISNSKEINLTDGHQKRDFLYIDDAVSAIKCILFSKIENGFSQFDIGTGVSTSVKDFIHILKRCVENKMKISTQLNFGAVKLRNNEPLEIVADISKIKQLGWKPLFDLNKGVNKMISLFF